MRPVEHIVEERWRTAEEIAELLAVPVSWVREHTRAGNVPHYYFGRYPRYRESEVREWAETCHVAGRAVHLRRYHPRLKSNAPAPRQRPGA